MKIRTELNGSKWSESNLHVHKGDRIKIFIDDKLVFKDDECKGGI